MSVSAVFPGAERAAALERVRAIHEALRRDPDGWPLSRPDDPRGLRAASLASGRAGLALFHAACARAGLADDAEKLASERLREAFEIVGRVTMDASLFCGFTGVAWVAQTLVAPEPGAGDPLGDVDDALAAALDDPDFDPPYDLIDGLAGLGVYALARRPRAAADVVLECVIARLEARAVRDEHGVSWPHGTRSRRAVLAGVADSNDTRWWNLGLAHGVPGVLGLLARCVRANVQAERARALLEGGASWLRAQRLPAGLPGAYADFLADDVPKAPARLAWCYGDPGVAIALVAAAQALGRDDLRAFARDVAHVAAARAHQHSDVVDTGLCHGSAGLGHVFDRLGAALDDPACREASRRWFADVLAPRPERGGVAGFATWSFERVREGDYVDDPCMLTGAAGVGLALLSACGEAAGWNAPFLTDVA